MNSGRVSADKHCIPRPVIEAKDGTRAGWVGLLERTTFTSCPDCGGPQEHEIDAQG